MTFTEWLNWACKHRGEHTDDRLRKHLFPELVLNDGTELSVQASEYHMCEPEETLTNGSEYESVEVYTHGQHLAELNPEREVSESTYPRVPIWEMEDICQIHGGIRGD